MSFAGSLRGVAMSSLRAKSIAACAATIYFGIIGHPALARDLVYQPVSPAFGGSPLNGSYRPWTWRTANNSRYLESPQAKKDRRENAARKYGRYRQQRSRGAVSAADHLKPASPDRRPGEPADHSRERPRQWHLSLLVALKSSLPAPMGRSTSISPRARPGVGPTSKSLCRSSRPRHPLP